MAELFPDFSSFPQIQHPTKNWKDEENRILICLKNIMTIGTSISISGYAELIPTAVSSI